MITTNNTKTSRAGQRRFNKKVRDFQFILSQSESRFITAWEKQVDGWISEIRRRAFEWQNGEEYRNVTDKSGIVERERHLIFGVVELAERLLTGCGSRAEQIVGEETRRILNAECVKAVANICGKELNSNFTQHWYRWAKN